MSQNTFVNGGSGLGPDVSSKSCYVCSPRVTCTQAPAKYSKGIGGYTGNL
jgi:hypothetical protein